VLALHTLWSSGVGWGRWGGEGWGLRQDLESFMACKAPDIHYWQVLTAIPSIEL